MNDLERERLVRENLAARVGQLTAENIELRLRIHELEHPGPALYDGNGHATLTNEEAMT
jgi:hypothetical protein